MLRHSAMIWYRVVSEQLTSCPVDSLSYPPSIDILSLPEYLLSEFLSHVAGEGFEPPKLSHLIYSQVPLSTRATRHTPLTRRLNY